MLLQFRCPFTLRPSVHHTLFTQRHFRIDVLATADISIVVFLLIQFHIVFHAVGHVFRQFPLISAVKYLAVSNHIQSKHFRKVFLPNRISYISGAMHLFIQYKQARVVCFFFFGNSGQTRKSAYINNILISECLLFVSCQIIQF